MNTPNTSDNATIDRIIEGAFIHAMDECLNDENKEAARTLANNFKRDYLDEGEGGGEVPEGSPLFLIAQGFILGANEGLNLARTIEECGR